MRTSFCDSASVSLKTGMPVHIETMSAISSSPISGCSPLSEVRHFFEVALLLRELALLVAQVRGLLELLRLDGLFLLLAHALDLVLELAVARRRGHRLDAHARRCLVDEVNRLVGKVAVLDVAVERIAAARRASSVIVQRWCAS